MKRRNFILAAASLGALSLPLLKVFAKSSKKGVYMITHAAESRGNANHGWLKSRHTFSFADYYNPERMGFGALRVINDDSVDPGMGFGTHPHSDMEIISIPLEGTLAHKDTEGNSQLIRKGEVQIMSAGTGIAHSEKNASDTEQVKFLQIWVQPKMRGIKPRYEQKAFKQADRQNKIATVVSPDGRDGSVTINQDAFFSLTDIQSGMNVEYTKRLNGNGVYVFVLTGEIEIDGKNFKARDGIAIPQFDSIKLNALANSEVLLMEVPA
jgi:redox-sensitive bicupin YhaK (pirin superfamily)